jgi:hypothetical protein
MGNDSQGFPVCKKDTLLSQSGGLPGVFSNIRIVAYLFEILWRWVVLPQGLQPLSKPTI